MNKEELAALWTLLEARLSTVLGEIDDLPSDRQTLIEEFIENREHGLAFEFLCEALLDRGRSMPIEQYDQLGAVADLMNMRATIEPLRKLTG